MATILIIDDDVDLASQVAGFLAGHGYEPTLAFNSRDAIDTGARVRPDLILTDWMLRDGLDGLRVAEALHVVGLESVVVMVTAFPSEDLRADAIRLGVSAFIEKPFEMDRLLQTLREAAAHPAKATERYPSLGVVEVDGEGLVAHANRRAREMFALTLAGQIPDRFGDLFEEGQPPDLEAAERRWVAAWPRSRSHINWHLRAQSPRVNGSRLVVMLMADDPHLRYRPLIELILGCRDDDSESPLDGQRVMVMENEELFRRLSERILTAARVPCYTTQTFDRTMRLLRQDPAVGVLLLDLQQAEDVISNTIEAVREMRPDLTIIGTGSDDRPALRDRLGIERFLAKPWTMTGLLHLLHDVDS